MEETELPCKGVSYFGWDSRRPEGLPSSRVITPSLELVPGTNKGLHTPGPILLGEWPQANHSGPRFQIHHQHVAA